MQVMKVRFTDILNYLESQKLNAELFGEFSGELTVASLFAPVEGGFYFYTGEQLPSAIVNSVAIVGKEFRAEGGGKRNCIIKLDVDPQLTYYRMLRCMEGVRSPGRVANSAIIDPSALVGLNVQIEDYCILGECVIGDNVTIGSHTRIYDGSTIGQDTIIESHSVIGARGVAWIWNEDQSEKIIPPQLGGVLIGDRCFLGANTIVVRGSLNECTTVGSDSLLAPGCRLGHGTMVGRYVHLANNVVTGGNSRIGEYSFVGSGAVFRPKVRVHDRTIVGAGAVVIKDTSRAGLTLIGVPAVEQTTKEFPSGMPKPKVSN